MSPKPDSEPVADREPGGVGEPPSELVRRAGDLLRTVAATGATVTYRELTTQLGPEAVDGKSGRPDLASVLRALSLSEEQAGRGLLSAVVVRPSGRPGEGWYRLAAEMGRDVSDPEAAWSAERRRLLTAQAGPASSSSST